MQYCANCMDFFFQFFLIRELQNSDFALGLYHLINWLD